ncbi:MAG: oxygenase MpaB family protein [Acidobacteria bacterium]|nr:oxygenase MpaB family protein [Acidobacteriota bacterium]
MLNVPACYVDGYNAARQLDPELAERYIRYTTLGDPLADRAVEQLAAIVEPHHVHRTIAQTVDRYHDPPTDTPEALRELIESSAVVPEWFDPEIAMTATRAFLRNSDMVLGGLVGGAIVEGFSTLISKSFRIRSRIILNGVRRLKQNTLQLTEQFMPGGQEPGDDAWKLSLRIRLVHAQARMLLKQSDEWDTPEHGMPLSAAHMLLGAAAFSGRLMHHVARLGGDFSPEEQDAYVHVWRYTGLVMGIPEAIMFHDHPSACRIFQIAATCEPPPDDDAIIMANSIINSAPILLGFRETKERREMAAFIYQVSRELIGNDLADSFRFPKSRFVKQVPLLFLRNRAEKVALKLFPRLFANRSIKRFNALLDASDLGEIEHSYALPTTLHDEDSRDW